MYRIRGSKIAEHWLKPDHLPLLKQTGVINAATEPVCDIDLLFETFFK
jgi:hypothetical protein